MPGCLAEDCESKADVTSVNVIRSCIILTSIRIRGDNTRLCAYVILVPTL